MATRAFDTHLMGMLNSPLGRDVYVSDRTIRGLLAREERQQDDGNGFGVMVWVTTLTVKAADVTTLRVEDRLDVSPLRAPWNALHPRSDCTTYAVRKIGREDDLGAREIVLTDVARGTL